MDTLPAYYQSNQKIGLQNKGIRSKFIKWEEFFPMLNSKMIDEFNIQSPTTTFINHGEMGNYLAFKFIASIQTIYEHGEF